MSCYNSSTMICRNLLLFYALILSHAVHVVLALIHGKLKELEALQEAVHVREGKASNATMFFTNQSGWGCGKKEKWFLIELENGWKPVTSSDLPAGCL